ncbi:tetratricopeptide repeat protein [Chryseobacterium defluvii]|uniref:Tetratricopeptide repeat protein n=1 Tax=Chryseobacterium defluvii TaxID=160396 RepID=A0A495SC95_9FLAO|nr:tetratricopeptide repeat protein [Chryseobacterium defluvii]RKS97862.1 tetratricopeptide repeat protein [Chryseobacterium defluvii]
MIKKRIPLAVSFFIFSLTFSQKEISSGKILKEASEKSCQCLDTISAYNKTKDAINKEVSSCINDQVLPYLLAKSLSDSTKETDAKGKDKKQINLNISPESKEYKYAYYDIESYMMSNCDRIRDLADVVEKHDDSMPKNKDALSFYEAGIAASGKENWTEAIKNYKLALEKDPKFSYAWDNLGISYRRTGEYDNALSAYKKSLEINPKGKMALQNIPITYVYKKEYQKAIDAYLDFDRVYPGDAEVYYGIGHVYYNNLKDSEKALDYICKAYLIYTRQKSPYRSDAEAIISAIYKDMKAKGKIEKFNEILKNNKIDLN